VVGKALAGGPFSFGHRAPIAGAPPPAARKGAGAGLQAPEVLGARFASDLLSTRSRREACTRGNGLVSTGIRIAQ